MLSYALRRIAGTVPTLLVIISVSFCVVRLAPGGPFAQEQALPPPVRANLERLYGLDEPLTVQYAHYLRWLPVAGWQHGAPRYLVLPVLTLALPVAAYLARLTRASLLEVLAAHYVLSARARGLGAARVLWRHALRPALMPVVSYLGPAVAFVMTGSLVVETVFGLPGTGRYLVEGAIDRDYPLVMGMVVVYGALTLLLNLIADLIYGALDPGLRRE